MALVTLANYKTYAGIPTGDTSNDSAITLYISLVGDWFKYITGKTLEAADLVEFYDGNGTPTLNLKSYPVNSITKIEARDDQGNYTTVDSTSYRYESTTGIVQVLGSARVLAYADPVNRLPFTNLVWSGQWCYGFQNYRATYNAGWATIPGSLQYAVYLAIDLMLANRGQAGLFNAESIGQYSYSRAKGDTQLSQIMGALGGFVSLPV